MDKTDEILFLVLLFLIAPPFFVFVLFFFMSGLFCCFLVPGTLAFHLLHTFIFAIVWFTLSHSLSPRNNKLYLSRMKNQHGHWV